MLGFIVGAFTLLPKRIYDDTIVNYRNQRGEVVFAKTVGHQYEGTDFVVVQRCDHAGTCGGFGANGAAARPSRRALVLTCLQRLYR